MECISAPHLFGAKLFRRALAEVLGPLLISVCVFCFVFALFTDPQTPEPAVDVRYTACTGTIPGSIRAR